MSEALTKAGRFSRARALKLHEHFGTVQRSLQVRGVKLEHELKRVSRLIDGMVLQFQGGEKILPASYKTLDKEWRYWLAGGRKGEEQEEYVCRPEALLFSYKSGNGGHRAAPRGLVKEFQRRMTLQTGGRDKNQQAPISQAYESLVLDFKAGRPLPGIDYTDYPAGAEFPWSYRTFCRKKPSRGLRLLGNVGASAYKNSAAHVPMDYSRLRKCELYTLDDVRLDIVCRHEATGEIVGAVCYILMEVASRAIVAYVIKPCVPDATSAVRRKSITEEDVAELLAYGLQAPGFGIGGGYTTHILFERGTTACSEAAGKMLEQVTDGGIRIHRTGMVGGVRWIGAARDQAKGNSTGKAVIESFNRQLHKFLLHLPGQRGNCFENQPQNMGMLGKSRYQLGKKGGRQNGGTMIDEDEYLEQLNQATGGTMKLKLTSLYFRELEQAVREAIQRHNTEPGHEYRGHGTFEQVQVQPGVWKDRENQAPSTKNEEPAKRPYTLDTDRAFVMGMKEKQAYWFAWGRVTEIKPDLDRHAITRRAIKANPNVGDLTREQFTKLLQVFAAIVRDATPPNAAHHS